MLFRWSTPVERQEVHRLMSTPSQVLQEGLQARHLVGLVVASTKYPSVVMHGPHVPFGCSWSFSPVLQVEHWVADEPLQVRQVEAHCLQVDGVVELSMNQPSDVLHSAQVLLFG